MVRMHVYLAAAIDVLLTVSAATELARGLCEEDGAVGRFFRGCGEGCSRNRGGWEIGHTRLERCESRNRDEEIAARFERFV